MCLYLGFSFHLSHLSYSTPIELVKCKMQVQMLVPASQRTGPLPGPLTIFFSTLRTQGFRGLWLGHTGTFIRETGGTAAWFGTKEYVAALLIERRLRKEGRVLHTGEKRPELKPGESAVAGACAGAAFNFILFPADSVKSTMQTAEELRGASVPAGPKATFVSTAKAMYRAQGIRGLYAGCGITVARSIPSSAIIFLVYDELKKTFG